MLVATVSDDGGGGADPAGSGLLGLRGRVEARGRHAVRERAAGRRHRGQGGDAMRAVIAEDQALLREGIVALLRENEVDVVAQAEDAEGLLRIVNGHKPDVAIVDVRLPPDFTDEGVRAALTLRRTHPEVGILILSQYVEPVYTAELLAAGDGGIGYLLKERVGDVPGLPGRRPPRGGRRHRAGPRGGGRAGRHARRSRARARWASSHRASARCWA